MILKDHISTPRSESEGSGHPQTRRGKQHMPKPWREM